MIKRDNILKEAKKLHLEFDKVKNMILEMCNELEVEKSLIKKEIIRKAITKSIDQLEGLNNMHSELINKL